MIGIYKITNLLNNKSYIGQSIKIEERWNEHKVDYFNKNGDTYNTPFYRAIRKYGLENFKFEVLEECLQNQLNEREKYWIAYYHTWVGDSNCQGYNLTIGGEGVGLKLIKLSQEEIKEIINLISTTSLSFKEIALKFNVTPSYIRSLNKGRYRRDNNVSYPLRKTNYGEKKLNYCIDCGCLISNFGIRCKKCMGQYLKLNNKSIIKTPSKKELLSKLYELKTQTKTAKYYNISTVLLEKWCFKYDIITKSKGYLKQYEEEILKTN